MNWKFSSNRKYWALLLLHNIRKKDAEYITEKIIGRNEMIQHIMIKHADSIIAAALPADHSSQQILIQAINSYHGL
jgi:hypothetical protein